MNDVKKVLEKAPAKVNIFLKIIGYRDGYHLINSRFMLVESLHDQMWFEPGNGRFEIVGDFDCEMEQNTIYKAYKAIIDHYPQKEIIAFAKAHKVMVYKNIPAFAGLGGGSSNAATFLKMITKAVGLDLTNEELMRVGMDVGADVPFFLSGYKSANVTGFGEIVTPFDEAPLNLKLKTPEEIRCSTVGVYKTFKKHFADTMPANAALGEKLEKMKSAEILKSYQPTELNDLFAAALKLCPELYEHKQESWFFSGSGSTFFKVAE
jgi:4-diphosphocytidyl-2-C-methyl-D-erythritol kinase